MQRSRFITVAAAAMLAAALPAVGHAQAETVDVVDNAFEAPEVTVEAGEAVMWSQSGANPHTVTSSDGLFDSHPDCPPDFDSCMGTGDTFEFTFDTPGTYVYYCKIHGTPDGGGMAGTITVTAADTTPSESPSPTETDQPVSGSITVSDQTGDGTSVTVDEVTISGADGFVVVHADADGAPGAVIGHTPISEGTSTDVSVPFDEALTTDQTVWPMLHVDAGEAGTYEFPGPDGPVSVDDQIVVAPLAYTVAAAVSGSITVSDQTGDGTSVTVDEVTISGADGFVVVHADADGAPGAVIGHTPISEGTSTDVSVPFDEALTTDQTVWPMLHVDAGEAGTYEFPGPDGPVSVDDQIVVAPLAYTVAAADDTQDTDTDDELADTGADVPVTLVVAALAAAAVGGATLLVTRRRPGAGHHRG